MALASAPIPAQQPGAQPAQTANPYAYVGNPADAPETKVDNYRWGNGGENDPRFQSERWLNQQSGAAPWLNNAQQATQTRNNYYYGGSQNAAADFRGQIAGVQGQSNAVAQGLANDFGESYDTAAFWEGQNQAARDQGKVLGDTFSGRATAAGKMGQQAAARDPRQFLDQQSIANNYADRASQVGAIGGLNQFIANGPAPSAAQAQLNQATDANMQNALALARSGRGMGQGAGALRQAIGQNALTQQQAGNQAAVLRAQEAQAWQQNQLGAYGQIGNLAAAARQGDLGVASYNTGSQQAARNAADQASLGYYGLQNQFGNQQLGALGQQQQSNAQGLQASQFGLEAQRANAQAQQANTQMQLGALGLQNQANVGQLQGNSDYENNLLNYYRVKAGQQAEKGTDYSPYLAAGGAILGAAIGGPGGAVAGGAAGNAIGSNT